MTITLSILGATALLDERVERSYDQGSVAVPREHAVLLGLTPRTVMETRTITVSTVGGFTALTSTTYLPPGSTDVRPWHEVEVGELAFLGGTVSADEFVEQRSRYPTPAERKALRMNGATPVVVVSHRCQVLVGGLVFPAGVIVLARGDLVTFRWS
jgi:hypothetical protein